MKIIIAGAGEVGTHLAKMLSNEALKELEIVLQFFRKNLELINKEKPVSNKTDYLTPEIEATLRYPDTIAYKHWKKTGKTRISFEEYMKLLDQSYKNNEISLHEMRRLVSDYQSENL